MKIFYTFVIFSLMVYAQADNICRSNHTQEACFNLAKIDYDANKKAQIDKEIELECHVDNKGSLSVAWLHDNQLISLNDQVLIPDSKLELNTDSTTMFNLKIKSVELSHKGLFRCQIISKIPKNLEYNLDVLIPPTITRIPSDDIIVLNEGESLIVQCLTQGNPKPTIIWSKTGEKPGHTLIDEIKSTLTLENVDSTHSDTYSCIAKNDVGTPVVSEFQVQVKFKPKIEIASDVNIKQNVMYSALGKKEHLKCVTNAFPAPKMSLLLNNTPILNSSYSVIETNLLTHQFVLTYSFTGSNETFGDYKCIAENEMGSSTTDIRVTAHLSEVSISADKLPIFSDAAVFEWSVYSGSQIQELNVQVFSGLNYSNQTNITTKTKQIHSDGTESMPTYHNENIFYKDYFDLTKLNANSSYLIRLRIKNEGCNEWSQWSRNISVRTNTEPSDNDKLIRHRSQMYNHHRQKQHKNQAAQQTGSRDLSAKRFNSYFNSASNLHLNKFSFLIMFVTIWTFY
ncbi:unnamed protein product [Brachionus calyciflorus]|uniref:Ig-like domain-containing protein n=1 Tax=Brachionus calyciflorus TaxID=104777 RepID=A0A813M7L4_9BILA|nr:unnamed protein product [Brachionus calyciflorus]